MNWRELQTEYDLILELYIAAGNLVLDSIGSSDVLTNFDKFIAAKSKYLNHLKWNELDAQPLSAPENL